MLTFCTELAKLALKADIGVGDLGVILKMAYVRAAKESASPSEPNVSRVSARTGMTRGEIAELLQLPKGMFPPAQRGGSRTGRVLEGWHLDKAFRDRRSGRPRRLERREFDALVKQYSGEREENAASILHELVQTGAVTKARDGRLEARRRTCAPPEWNLDQIDRLGTDLADHLNTLVFNLDHPYEPRIEGSVRAPLRPNQANVVLAEIRDDALGFLETVGDTLRAEGLMPRSKEDMREALDVRLGVWGRVTPLSAAEAEPRLSGPRRRVLRTRGTSGKGSRGED